MIILVVKVVQGGGLAGLDSGSFYGVELIELGVVESPLLELHVSVSSNWVISRFGRGGGNWAENAAAVVTPHFYFFHLSELLFFREIKNLFLYKLSQHFG